MNEIIYSQEYRGELEKKKKTLMTDRRRFCTRQTGFVIYTQDFPIYKNFRRDGEVGGRCSKRTTTYGLSLIG